MVVSVSWTRVGMLQCVKSLCTRPMLKGPAAQPVSRNLHMQDFRSDVNSYPLPVGNINWKGCLNSRTQRYTTNADSYPPTRSHILIHKNGRGCCPRCAWMYNATPCYRGQMLVLENAPPPLPITALALLFRCQGMNRRPSLPRLVFFVPFFFLERFLDGVATDVIPRLKRTKWRQKKPGFAKSTGSSWCAKSWFYPEQCLGITLTGS